MRILDKTELAPLMSPQHDENLPIHNWYTFKHGYSRDLAAELISTFDLAVDSWVLDPFCGGGATLLTCKEMGLNSSGFDILPFSVFLSNVKTGDYDVKELKHWLEVLMRNSDSCCLEVTLPDIQLINRAFNPDVKNELLLLKQRIEHVSDPLAKSFFNMGFLSILEQISNTSKSGGFLRMVNRKATATASDIGSLFFNKVASMIEDVINCNKHKGHRAGISSAKIGDARNLPTNKIYDAVLTSPPYPNRHDYTRIYSLEMVFDFVSSNDALKRIRYETLRSHVEAKKKYEAIGYIKPAVLDNLITEVKRNGTNNPQVVNMLEGYFEDMYLSLSEMHRCLRNNGKVALVISNVRFAGVNIMVDEILAEIGSQVGLIPKEIWVVRYRGNSAQQMRDYGRKPSRESIVIWGKDAN